VSGNSLPGTLSCDTATTIFAVKAGSGQHSLSSFASRRRPSRPWIVRKTDQGRAVEDGPERPANFEADENISGLWGLFGAKAQSSDGGRSTRRPGRRCDEDGNAMRMEAMRMEAMRMEAMRMRCDEDGGDGLGLKKMS
jgi:hypothetical protein